MNKDLFKSIILEYFNCDDNVFDMIETYKKLLIDNNQKFNLTKLDTEEKIYLNYFFESIIVYNKILKNENCQLLDIGSGSGIPGILIKLFFPKIDVMIIESNNKKCEFMNLVIQELKLENINVICKRAEEIDDFEREKFDYVTSRAVASLKVLLEISAPYTKIDGLIIEPKSFFLDEELIDSKEIIEELYLEEIEIIKNKYFERVHNVIIFKKNKRTPFKFPREWKEIVK